MTKTRRLPKTTSTVFDARPSLPRATQEVKCDRYLGLFIEELESTEKKSRERTEQFATRFLQNPRDAFEWSQGVFEAAADLDVAKGVLFHLNQAKEQSDEYSAPSSFQLLTWVQEDLRSRVMNEARYGSNSSSPQHNEMKRSLLQASAKVLEKVEAWLKYRF